MSGFSNPNNPRAPLVLTSVVADEGELGPAMQALKTDRQRLFVVALLQQGGRNYAMAARNAGYVGTDEARRVTGWRLAHDSAIQEAMREESQRMLGGAIGLAADFVASVIEDPSANRKDRLRAAEMLFNRTGLPAQTEHKVTIKHELSDKDKIAKIIELAKRNGINPKTLLGDVVDGEFTEVPFEEHSDVGLEDLL